MRKFANQMTILIKRRNIGNNESSITFQLQIYRTEIFD